MSHAQIDWHLNRRMDTCQGIFGVREIEGARSIARCTVVSEHFAKLQRQLERYELIGVAGLIIIAALACWLVIGTLFQDVDQFVGPFPVEEGAAPNQQALSAYSAAGEFFNLRYNVPIAIFSGVFGGAIALLLTYFAMKAAGRQGDVAILEFVELRLSSLRSLLPRVAAAFKRVLYSSNRARSAIPSTSESLNAASREKRYPDTLEGYKEFLEGDDASSEFREKVDQMCKALSELSEKLTELSDDVMIRAYAERRIKRADQKQSPLIYLSERMPSEVDLREWSPYSDIDDLLSVIKEWSDRTGPVTAYISYMRLPPRQSTLEFVGFSLDHLDTVTIEPVSVEGGEIVGYSFNVGTASLMWAMKLLTLDEADIIEVFQNVFAGRAHALRDYLEELPLYRGASTSWQESIDMQFSNLDRLISVTLKVGNGYQRQIYSEEQHGPIQPENLAIER